MSDKNDTPEFPSPPPMQNIPGAPKTNPFGGKNPVGLYVPMSDDEQEVIERLVDSEDIELIIHGWATLDKPVIRHGDLRICVLFRLDFHGAMTPLHYLDLELKQRNGLSLYRQKMPTEMNGQPVMVGQGVFIDFAWDIALDHMKPEVVKAIKPGAIGLTSRRIDKATGERTAQGNMNLTGRQQNFLRLIEEGASKIREEDAKRVEEVVKKADEPGQ